MTCTLRTIYIFFYKDPYVFVALEEDTARGDFGLGLRVKVSGQKHSVLGLLNGHITVWRFSSRFRVWGVLLRVLPNCYAKAYSMEEVGNQGARLKACHVGF